MLWFPRASEGLAGFLGKILVALKKNFPVQFSLIFNICIPVPGLCILCIFGDPCQVSKIFKKKRLNFWIIALIPPHVCSVRCNLENK